MIETKKPNSRRTRIVYLRKFNKKKQEFLQLVALGWTIKVAITVGGARVIIETHEPEKGSTAIATTQRAPSERSAVNALSFSSRAWRQGPGGRFTAMPAYA